MTTYELKAKACLWFAWETTISGPEGEVGDDYAPHSIDLTDVESISISVGEDDLWAHHPSADSPDCASNANGRDREVGLQNPDYQNYIGASYIDVLTTKLNTLIGMWQYGDGPPITEAQRTTPFRIGTSWSGVIPANATALFLGFHDGREWTNNEGSVMVTYNRTRRVTKLKA